MTATEKKKLLLIQKAEEMKLRVAEQFASVQPEKHVVIKKEEATDIDEIGGEWFKMWTKKVQVLGWEEKKKSVKVLVDGEKSTYSWPLHHLCRYHTAIHFEAEPRYMERFGNSRKVTFANCEYIVARDRVWYLNGRPIDKDHPLIAVKWSEFSENMDIKSDEPWIM